MSSKEFTNGKLTLKQEKFVNAYVKNGGNGTDAVKKAGFNIKTDNTAATIATEYLRKPHVKEAISDKLNKIGLTQDYIGNKLMAIADSGTQEKKLENATVQDALKSLEFVARLHGLLNKNVTIDKKSVVMSFKDVNNKELTRKIKQFNSKLNDYVTIVE